MYVRIAELGAGSRFTYHEKSDRIHILRGFEKGRAVETDNKGNISTIPDYTRVFWLGT